MTTATPTLPQTRRLPLPRLGGIWRAIRRHPSGAIGLFGVTFFLLMAFIGPLIVPVPRVNVQARSQPPSFEHILGTDNQGKDIAAQIVHGSRPVITVAVLTGLITTGIAITLGALAAFFGGLFDRVVNSAANFVLTIPYLVAMTVLASFIRLNSPIMQAIILSLWSWPVLMRTVRAQVLSLREREYVEAAVALNLGTPHIIFREILPNMASYIAISMILAMTSAIYAQIALITLGLVPLSDLNWGRMIFLARTTGALYLSDTVWFILAPVMAIALFQWSLVTLARSIEDVFNPRLRSGA